MPLSNTLRRIRMDLHFALAQNLEAKIDTLEAVAIGFELWRIIDLATKSIEPIKSLVRLAAESTGKRGQAVYLQGKNRTGCMVTIPDMMPKLRKNIDVPQLRQVLGPKYAELFSEQVNVQPRPNFGELTKELTPEQLAFVLNVVDLTAGTSRVSFEIGSAQVSHE